MHTIQSQLAIKKPSRFRLISWWPHFIWLPVCQETVWEAFKIFWDRLPEQGEYQSWMNKCQEGLVTAQDIGSYFSQSEEHQALVKQVSRYNKDLHRQKSELNKYVCWLFVLKFLTFSLYFQRMSHVALKR